MKTAMGQWVEESKVTNITEFEFECRYLEDIWSKHIDDVSKHFELVKIEIVKENKEHLNLYKGEACKKYMGSNTMTIGYFMLAPPSWNLTFLLN